MWRADMHLCAQFFGPVMFTIKDSHAIMKINSVILIYTDILPL